MEQMEYNYRVVLTPNYERTRKLSSSPLLRIGPIPTINKEFSLHTRE